MKNPVTFTIPLLLMLSTVFGQPGEDRLTLELSGPLWEFRQEGSETWLPASVPGCVHSDLQNIYLVPDPYERLNERDLQWIDKVNWIYRLRFDVDPEIFKKQNIELLFEGIDTYSEVFLNEKLLLKTDNMFRTWRVDVKDAIRKGENELTVFIKSPTMTGLEKLKEYGFQLAADNDQSETGGMGPDRVSPYVRKAPYHFGWDWGPRLVTSGIWRPVKLLAWDEVIIEDVWVKVLDMNPQEAKILLSAEIDCNCHCDYSYSVSVNRYILDREMTYQRFQTDDKAAGTVKLEPGKNKLEIPLIIKDPRRWWPNGMGDQPLYRIGLKVSGSHGSADARVVTTGLRTAELVREPDPEGDGESFCFRVNGTPVFSKGANYIPNDVFLDRVSPERYESVIRSAVEANMNMLRVWGGGIYENDIFYDLCDRYGIMVWQDFMFACAMYPGNSEFLENVRLEAVDNVRRLRNHPCIVLWCGNNEIEAAWAEYEENRGWGWKQRYDPGQRGIIWKAYDTLFHHILPAVVKAHDPDRFYWHSSPSAGPGKLASYESNSGDIHYWGVWHGQHPLGDYRKYRSRFMSEYGFQSFPEYSTVKRYAILPEDEDIESEVMMAHQRSGIGNLRIRQYMEVDYMIPEDFESFLYVSQLLQAEAISTAIKSHRSDMPYCMGSLYWQLNDCWPAASWSGIDYYGRWKALHYYVKRAFQPVILDVFEADEMIKMRIVNDAGRSEQALLELRLMDFEGRKLWSETIGLDVPATHQPVRIEHSRQAILRGHDTAAVVLVSTLSGPGGTLDLNMLYFARPKALKLPDPEISHSITETHTHFEIRLQSGKLAKDVYLTAGGLPGRFTDNFFDMVPGEERVVFYPKVTGLDQFMQELRILHLKLTMN